LSLEDLELGPTLKDMKSLREIELVCVVVGKELTESYKSMLKDLTLFQVLIEHTLTSSQKMVFL
jgi:hypothetical protein